MCVHACEHYELGVVSKACHNGHYILHKGYYISKIFKSATQDRVVVVVLADRLTPRY
jgi:hypothetical protein